MNDSGSSSSFTRRISGAERILQAAADGQKTGGRLVRTPEDFKPDERKPTRLNGEVVEERKGRDGKTKRIVVRTPKGDVEVERDGQKPLPRKGQYVEIEIPPRRSGQSSNIQNVIIRTDNTVQPSTTQPQSQESLRISTTPVDVQIKGEQPASLPSVPGPESLNVAKTAPSMQELIDLGAHLRFTGVDLSSFDHSVLSQFYTAPQFNTVLEILAQQDILAPVLQLDHSVLSALHTENISIQAPLDTAPITQNLSAVPDVHVMPLSTPDQLLPVVPTQNIATLPDTLTINVVNVLQEPVQTVLQVQTQAGVVTEQAPLPPQMMVRVETVTSPLAWPIAPEGEQGHLQQPSALQHLGAELLQDMQQVGTLRGVVVGQTTDHLPIVTVLDGRGAENAQSFVLHAAVEALPAGTQITFTPITDANAALQTTQNIAPVPLPVFMQASNVWPSLGEVLQVLTANNPQAAQAFSSIAPNPGNPAQLVPALMLFVAAVRGGDLSTWLGDRAMDLIRRSGRGDVMGRIGQEAGLLARMSGGPISGDWQGINIPFFWDGEFQKAGLYYRDHEEEGADGPERSKRKHTRFVFDLSLSNMGGVQVDGLLRQDRLDVILRTERMLSQDMQRDMRRVYTGAIGQTEFTGELSFQSDPRKWVNITPDDKHVGVEA